MTDTTLDHGFGPRGWVNEKIFLGMPLGAYLRSLLTPGNLVVALILLPGIPAVIYRFVYGIGAVANLTQANPWGLWIGLDVMSGVALAAGGFTIATMVHVLGLKDYQPVVRPALLTGFLGYLFVVIGLMVDLGRPWNLPVPMVYSFGTGSVMFEVGWCVALYLTVLALEFSPAAFEWLGLKKAREWAIRLTLGLTILGLCLSTLHQSSLGALFLMMPHRVHPLWYSGFVPVFFFVSAVAAGLAMVIVEGALSHRAFPSRVPQASHAQLDRITIGLSRAAALVLFAYFFLKLQGLVDSGRFDLLNTGYGYWFLFEMIGFILAPSFLFAIAARRRQPTLARWVAGWTVLGIVVNRLNLSVIAFNWNAADRYVPSAAEILISVTIITIGVMTFRWIVNRMPVLREDPAYPPAH
ncbi:MAG TPA: Ni/Fe-hydrogenase cytochrome b subunit [Vicinamibacterales bacterium]|nr:Ni/Fe-hydrogenase cytochrome b subunit [Vicinamibacterales bacterium]